VPTATSAASTRPTDSDRPKTGKNRLGLITTSALALATALTIGFGSAEAPTVAASASRDCSSHASYTRAPRSIRVLRVHSGRIQTVPFRKYIVTVMGKEWPSYLPQPVVEAGAVAVKQYAWYHAIFSSRSHKGRCYDVKDSTGDQLYKPQKSRVSGDHYRALDKTWNVTLRKDGRFFMTGYRRGAKVRCGKDKTGYKLYARSAIQCARKGYGYQQILRTYYGPRLSLVGAGGQSSSRVTNVYAADTTRAADATRTVQKPRRPDTTRVVQASNQRQRPASAGHPDPKVRPQTVDAPWQGGSRSGGIGAILDRRGFEVF
jgi:hypothetical protein